MQVYAGYVDDPRNTDNAWMETVAKNFHDEAGMHTHTKTFFFLSTQFQLQSLSNREFGSFEVFSSTWIISWYLEKSPLHYNIIVTHYSTAYSGTS